MILEIAFQHEYSAFFPREMTPLDCGAQAPGREANRD
jgi:hypothetical protein